MADETAAEITFHYIKSPQCRTIHVDGVFGGITPKANICFAFFSERFPIPNTTTQAFDAHGVLGAEIRREAKLGVIRELEINCIMDINTAKMLGQYLAEKVTEIEQIQELQKNASK